MKIKLKQDLLVGDHNRKAGDWVEVSDEKGKELVALGHAEELKDDASVKEVSSVPAAEVKIHEDNEVAERAADFASPPKKGRAAKKEYPDAVKPEEVEPIAEAERKDQRKVERADARDLETADLKK